MPPVHPRTLAQTLGKEAKKRGRTSEARVIEALALPTRPPWMRAVRKAAFLERRRRARVAIVVVHVTDSPGTLLHKVAGELGKIRAEFVKERRGEA